MKKNKQKLFTISIKPSQQRAFNCIVNLSVQIMFIFSYSAHYQRPKYAIFRPLKPLIFLSDAAT